MHRAFYGLRPAFGIGRDYMGADGMSKAAVILGGMNGPTDDIVDPFLGDVQTVNPPFRVAAPLQPQQPLPQAKAFPFPPPSPLPRRSIDYHSLEYQAPLQPSPYRQPVHPHPPTPISTLLAFKKQVRNDAAHLIEPMTGPPAPALSFSTIAAPVAPLTPPQDKDMDMSLGDDFDLAQELDALENMSMNLMADAFEPAMGTWSTDTSSMQYRAEPDDSAAAIPMNLISTQLPRTIPGLSALHTPTHTHASPTPAVASAKSSTVHTPRTKSYVHKACVSCKTSHVACDVTRPCQRCVRSGKASSCIDAERKKRGRPTSSTAVVQKPSLSLSPEPATHPVKTASRPKKRSRHANSDAPALSAFTPAITAEIGAQLQRLQAGMNESDGFIVTDEMVQAVTALSTLLPTQDAAGQQQMNYNDQDVKVEPEDETQDSAMEAATAATALLAGLRDFNPDIMMEFYENFSGFGEQSQCMFGDPTLLPPQIVTANDLMGGTTNM